MALADVNCLTGLVDFLRASEGTADVRPLVAAEIADAGGRAGRLVALVETEQGYRNLCRLVSARQLGRDLGVEDPDEEFDLIQYAAGHQAGLFFLADHPRLLLGLHGRVPAERLFAAISPAALRLGGSARRARAAERNTHRAPAAREDVSAMLAARTEDELKLPKCPAPAPAVPAPALVEAARATGVATLAVPDVYHLSPAGAADHRLRVAIKHNALLEDLPLEWQAPRPAHLPTFAEMCALYADLPEVCGPWRGDAAASTPGAVRRTALVAECCHYTPPLDGLYLPEIHLEGGETASSKLRILAYEGARARYGTLPPQATRRLDYELAVIEERGYAPYFLLVEQIADYARRQGIPCIGRGSAADSLVAFCMGLTDADPLRYRLPFERFLNPQRRDRPDIDLDFCWRRRDEVLEHVGELFGVERTAMISTLNRFGMRSAFRETALAHGIPPAEIHPWSKRLPMLSRPWDGAEGEGGEEEPERERNRRPARSSQGEPTREGGGGGGSRGARRSLPRALAGNPLAEALRTLPEAHAFPFDDERFTRALQDATGLLDAPRHLGLHPGGIVVAPGPITDLVTCQYASKPHPTRGQVVVTQLDKDAVEAIGLVKMDLLGNRALTTIDDCQEILRAEGIDVDLEGLPEDDPSTAATLRAGRTLGCFQIESPGMRNLLQQTGARTMDDVIQAVALIRPGPAGSGMKDAYIRRFRGLEDPTPPHPRLADVLRDTHGVMLYQEDVMQAASRVAGMDLARADQLRRALQKHRSSDLATLRECFHTGCRTQGIEPAVAAQIWELVANFSSFAFCKAHAVTYGRIAYHVAWLKTHHPAALLIAFLASETGYYPARVYVEEARRLGVPILPPDVNRSEATFASERVDGALGLRIGLGQVKGLSERTLEAILGTRDARGPFLSLPDFLDRTRAHVDETEALVQCGAFDAFDRTRPELLWRLHLLKTPRVRPPRGAALDPQRLAACRATPARRTAEIVRAARARTGGWTGRGIGVGDAELPPGAEATLFPDPGPEAPVLPGLPEPDRESRAKLEFDLLGLCIDAHPSTLFPCRAEERLQARSGAPRPANPIPCGRLSQFRGGRVTLRGWPAATRRVRTEQGQLMRFLTLEDESGLAEVVLFPDVYRRDGRFLAEKGVLLVTGVVEDLYGACTLHAERVW